ncbi:SLX4I protein, partial [Turnix velox]|nr:SLX4I protein [Turnix velox]
FFSFFFSLQCGNFAVLVDVNILPQGSSKDTSWFSDHEKEEVCMLLEEVVASRVKHYLEAPKQRGQCKSIQHAPSEPLFLTAKNFHITAYFMKRWVNLRCAVGKRYRELRVFPERFIVCVSKLEFDPSVWMCENGVLKEELSSGTSEYFTESAVNKKPKISLHEQIKQDILKKIVKRKKTKKSSTSKHQIRKGCKSVDSQTGNKENDCQSSLSPPSEVNCRSMGQLKDCTNTAESSLELPVSELENHVNQRQPDDVGSQQKTHSVEWLKSGLLSENPPCSYESALLGPKQSQKVIITRAQQKSCGAEKFMPKVSLEAASLIPSNAEVSKCNDDCLDPFLEEKTSLNSRLFSKQDVTKTARPDEESQALGKSLLWPLSASNDTAQTNKIEPSMTTEELSQKMSPSAELQPVSSERLTQKRKKEAENGLRKLKLRRLKKS